MQIALSVYWLTSQWGYSDPAPPRAVEQRPVGHAREGPASATRERTTGRACTWKPGTVESIATREQRPHRGRRPGPSSSPGTGRAHRGHQDAPAQTDRAARAAAGQRS